MSGKICTDNGGTTLKVKNCSDLGGTDAGDIYGAFCKVTSGPDTGKVVTKSGDVATYDSLTTSTTIETDPQTGQQKSKQTVDTIYFVNPSGGLRVGVSRLTEAEQTVTTGSQGQNVASFELCEIGSDPYKSLITYNDGRAAKIDASKKTEKGQLAFVSPDGKSTRIVSGLTDEQIKVTTDMQGVEIGSCNSAKGFGTSYALLPTRTSSGSPISWSKEDLDLFRKSLGGTSDRAFFCADSDRAESGTANSTTIAVNMSEGNQSIVRPVLEALASGQCGSMEADKCEIAFESLREQFKSNFPFADPIKTTGDYIKEYGLYGLGLVIVGLITGAAFALTGRWLGGGGGGHGGGGGSGITTDDIVKILTAAATAAAQKAAESMPSPPPEAHQIGVEVPAALAVVVAAEAAPVGFWAGVGEFIWGVGEGAVGLGARAVGVLTMPIFINPDEMGPNIIRPTSGSYYMSEQYGI